MTVRTVIGGIDPGASGALAFIDAVDWTIEVLDMPHEYVTVNGKKRKHVDKQALGEIFRTHPMLLLSTEKVHSMPGMHAASVFSFGRYYGQIEMAAVLTDTAVLETDPAKWKAKMGVNSDKDLSRERASQLVPAVAHLLTRKTDHDRAEAVLLALFGCFTLGRMPGQITLKE